MNGITPMMLLLSNHIEKYVVALRVRVSVCKDKNLPRLYNLKFFDENASEEFKTLCHQVLNRY